MTRRAVSIVLAFGLAAAAIAAVAVMTIGAASKDSLSESTAAGDVEAVRPSRLEARPRGASEARASANDPNLRRPSDSSTLKGTPARDSELRARLTKEIEDGIALMRDGSVVSRVQGASSIKMAFLGARSADPELMTLLRDPALAVLLPALADVRRETPGSQLVRAAIVDALRTWDWDGSIVVPGLSAAWDDGSPALRAGILDAIVAMRPELIPVSFDLRALLRADDDDLRASAFRAFDRTLEVSRRSATLEDLDAVQKALDSASPVTRGAALDLVQRLDVVRPPTLARDVERLWDDPDPHVRGSAVRALVRLEPEHALSLALTRLKDRDWTKRTEAVWAFSVFSAEKLEAAGAADAVLATLADPDEKVRASAANALAFVPALKDRAVPLLVERAAEGGHVGYEALASLARLDRATATPLLESAATHRDPWMRLIAIVIFEKDTTADHVRILVAALWDDDEKVRSAADRALLQRVTGTLPVDELVIALDKAPRSRGTVIQALAAQGARARSALPALERFAADPQWSGLAKNAIARIEAAK